jgi:hypothetical protein
MIIYNIKTIHYKWLDIDLIENKSYFVIMTLIEKQQI